ncbi:MAG: polyphenol oxidase family protein [Muribaculaceae bacterium]|nr:polyphenol oxidase family protein [Muribaculaceae bacterium]
MSVINIQREPLLMDDMVSGLCLIPDPCNPEIDKSDLSGLLGIWAITPVQTHSCNVEVVDGYRRYFENTDALITFEPDVPIGVKTADCVPILVYAPDRQCVGAIHAGWKGTLGGIVDNVMEVLEERGVDPSCLRVAFGPSISRDVYEVDRTLADRFIQSGFGQYVHYPYGHDKKPHIDLQGVNMERFMRRGVKRENITLHSGCSFGSKKTDGSPKYASHRRSGGAPLRMLTCVMILSKTEKERYARLFNGIG